MDDEDYKAWFITQFRLARVAGLHIDLEEHFIYDPGNNSRCAKGLISRVNSLSQILRSRRINNYWAAGGFNNQLAPYSEFKASKRPGFSALHPDLDVPDDDLVATNTMGNIFSNSKFVRHLKKVNHRTLIMTGVFHDACFLSSVKGAVEKEFNVLACTDATDCLPDNQQEFRRSLKTGLTSSQRERLHVTSTDFVLKLIR